MARGKKTEKALSPEEKLAQALVPAEEQPYPVPGNWCWCKLDELYQVNLNPKNVASDDIDAAFIPMEKIASGMVSDFSFDIQPWKTAKKGHTQFADGDVAFAKISPCFENRKSMILHDLPNGIGGGTTELIILRQPYVLPRYTFWLVSDENFIQGGKRTYSGTVGQQRISMNYVKNYPVPLPPIPEQQRIVARIESLFAKLDEAKEKAQTVVDGFETRKAAILHKAFAGELSRNWRRIHNIQLRDWDNLTLGDIADYKKGPFGSSITKVMFVPKGPNTYKVYEQGNAIRKTLDYGHYYISQEKYNELRSFSVRAGDIIISCAGTIGETFTLPVNCEPGVINQALMRVRVSEKISKSYFLYYFSGVIKSNVNDEANGTAIKNVIIVLSHHSPRCWK